MRFHPRDPSLLSESERLIRELYEISADYAAGLESQIARLLAMGSELFDLEIGILSEIEGECYRVVETCHPPDVALARDDEFDLGMTYCAHTVEADGPVGFEHAGNEIPEHPAYKALGLESYIGVPVKVNGAAFGTLNFSSPHPRRRSFEPLDVECLQLMATWVGTELGRHALMKQLAASAEELDRLSNTDPLTDVLNRRGAERELGRLRRQVRRDKAELAAILIDVDDFKRINDVHGHTIGDRALTLIADSIRGSLRPLDLVARIGGDEFLVVAMSATKAQAVDMAERIAAKLALARLPVERDPRQVTVSMGVAMPVTEAGSISAIVKRAGIALKNAKRGGKNRVAVAE